MKQLTDAELLLLGLVAEMPRHGYELDQVIRQRGMREWTQIGFSSIYFVLGKLQKMGLVTAKKPLARRRGLARRRLAAVSRSGTRRAKGTKARKVYSVTPAGRRALAAQTIAALRDVRPAYSSVLLGMINWPALNREQSLKALQARSKAIESERTRLGTIQVEQQPLPDYVEALFEYSLGQLRAEAEWVSRTLAYMTSKPWLE
jgi:DNA-binding PadR family transcriptional regulator